MSQLTREQMDATTGRLPNESTQAWIQRQQNLALSLPQKKPPQVQPTREEIIANAAAAQARRDHAAKQKAQAEAERKAALVGNVYAQALDTNVQLNPKQRKHSSRLRPSKPNATHSNRQKRNAWQFWLEVMM